MKVIKDDHGRDDHALAARLGFLRQACRVTFQGMAETNGTQRSNLSAFVTSGGQTRNVAYEKLDRILFSLGVLPDGTLTPGLHRWQIKPNMARDAADILWQNDFEAAVSLQLSTGADAYLVVRVAENILVFVGMEPDAVTPVMQGLEKKADLIRQVRLDRAGDSSIQSLWMTKEDVRVEKLLLSLFN